MNNQPIRPEDIKQAVRSVKCKPSEEELANSIRHEEALIYGVPTKRWKYIDGVDHGYAIYYKDDKEGPSKMEIRSVIQNEFRYLEAYDVLVGAIFNALYATIGDNQ